FFVLLAALAAGFLINRYSPTNERMSGYIFFDVPKETENLVIIDGERYPDTGCYIDGQLYLAQEFIAKNINVRYYYDKESNGVLYTDSKKTYTFLPGDKNYSDSSKENYTSEYPVAVDKDGMVYLNWEFVAGHTNCTYEYGTEPARLSIKLSHDEVTTVTSTKKTALRYRAGIKSPILEEIKEGTQLQYVDGVDDWSRVITPSGFSGYVKNSTISEQVTDIPEDTFTDNHEKITKDYKISLAWFQVAGTFGNELIDDYLTGTSGITTISPTWYSITDEAGNMDSYATEGFVSDMHSRGIEVWPLVSDFNTEVDFKALYSSKTSRTNIISRLMADAKKYDYDGINIDFENIRTAYSQDFLQFIRELSVECEKEQLVLSTDNYKPESYNECYNLKEQASYIDYSVLMAYDEHYSGSDAGSVASLPFVEEGIKDMIKLVPKEQVLAAVPFYTRVWTTKASGTTSVAVSMQTALDQLSIYGVSALWSEESGQYIMSAEGNGGTVQIWFEEDRSIGEKMKKIKQYDIAGAAAWRLGLENSSVWDVINQYLN
ncbi:MAG: glycosyl hydrolase family 18 protein, partial [Eubacteriales bacterium]|nr:glycosyl hydrolase family 18 protein [Eubacteriales bacterium]